MKAPAVLGCIFFLIGLVIISGLQFSQPDQTSLFGFTVIDADDQRNLVLTALWMGASFSLMVCGVLVVIASLPFREKSQ
jgi:hypothetical protein